MYYKTIGNRIIQGDTECELKNGRAVFDKIHINEVTSKFINGFIGLMITPKVPNNFKNKLEIFEKEKNNGICVDNIKPLMLEKIIVKSKKKKQVCEQVNEVDTNHQEII